MTVERLIELLKGCNPKAVVSIPYLGMGWWPVTGFTYDDDAVDLHADNMED
jgi:hypothetical protein